MTTQDDRNATQEFTLLNILVGHCGKVLSPAEIEKIVSEMMEEIKSGATAWAFSKDEGQ